MSSKKTKTPKAAKKAARARKPEKIACFPPVVDERSEILILGTMPGPEALRRREYYGFPGNHFWRIMRDLFAEGRELDYAGKIELVRKHGIALWETILSCERVGASDASIKRETPADIAALIEKHPRIRKVFLNGKTSEKLYLKYNAGRVAVPAETLPSTSPAHAIPYREKLAKWKTVQKEILCRKPK